MEKKKFWIIPITVPAYLYAMTILTMYGYDSYFGIPNSFLNESLREVVIYFFILFQGLTGAAKIMRGWVWIVLFALILEIVLLYFSHWAWEWFIKIALGIFLIIFLLNSFKFGNQIAANTTSFYILPQTCLGLNTNLTYIVPDFYGSEALIIPVDSQTKKMVGGLMVKETSELPCSLSVAEIGKVTH